MSRITFQKTDDQFWSTLRQRVNQYFLVNQISRYTNIHMNIKIAVMLAMFIVPYIVLLAGDHNGFTSWCLCLLMGFGMAGIGFNISHQAAHNAVSRNRGINRLFSLSFNLVGFSDYIWKIKHNVFHHTYTNVYEEDEALKEGEFMRFSADAPHKKMHRFQHIYGFLLYALFTFFWVFFLDVEKYFRYRKTIAVKNGKHPLSERVLFFATKVYYLFIAFVLPYLCEWSIPEILLGFFTVHVIASLLITHVLQVEHLAMETEHVSAGPGGLVQKPWAQNQLEGTCNFKTRSKIFEWYIGGCNYQIEHHLFPTICSIHYPALSKIVAETAREFNLKYIQQPSFQQALVSHYRFLKQLGKNSTK